jgi:Tol biopolymer transport system component
MAGSQPLLGQTISHYRILEKVGEGGMGVVYKARDTHLDRFVAIKVLPADKVADPERKRRFVQEAKSASALNHPNIITVYDIANQDGIDFIAMEHVPGRTLDHVIPRKGLPLGDALRLAVQIADALATAHAAGILHRDLKPSNVMVSGAEEQGRLGPVKVLDFGLAKLIEKSEDSDFNLTGSIRDKDALSTQEGVIVGTVSYMSPEQAEGRKVDVRSDIFSFGALLYEMVTGQRAFRGDSRLSTLSAILRDEPKPVGQLVEGLPRELERIIARCLRKNPERRFQTMADLRVALEELKEESDSGTLGAVSAPKRRSRQWLLWALPLATLLIIAGILWFARSNAKAPQTALKALPLTTYSGFLTTPSFSPDGNQVTFSWDGEKGDNLDIYVKLIGTTGPPLRLTTDTAGDYGPVWSPDGRFIAFVRGNESHIKDDVLLVPALGGPERKVGEIAAAGGRPIAWSVDGNSLVVSDRDSPKEPFRLFLLSIETGEKRRLTSPSGQLIGDSWPAFSPDGRTLAFSRLVDAGLGDLYQLTFKDGLEPSGEAKRITFENQGAISPAWTSDGREIVFSTGLFTQRTLWKLAAPGSMSQPEKPEQLLSLGGNVTDPASSPHGHRLVYVHRLFHSIISRIAAPGGSKANNSENSSLHSRANAFISSTRSDSAPNFSPDGEKIAFMSDRSGSPEIWVCDKEGLNAVQLTSFGGPAVTNPRWSPDGSRIAFDSNAPGQFEIWVISATGGKSQRMTTDPANDGNPSWSRDGKWIYFDSARSGEQQIWKIPANGGEAIQITRDGGFGPNESRDGRTLYYAKALDATTLWKVAVEGGQSTKVLDSLSSHLNLAIVADGIYFVPIQGTAAHSSLQFLDFATGRIRTVASFEKPLDQGETGGVAISPDGRWILSTQFDQVGSELMLVEKFNLQ